MSHEEGFNRLTIIKRYYELIHKAKPVGDLRCYELNELNELAQEILKNRYSGLFVKHLSNNIACIKSLIPIALDALTIGADPEVISKYLTWRDFEEFILEYLDRYGYFVTRNIRFGLRRYEIDVLAINYISKYGLAIDCKHWRTSYRSYGRVIQAARRHRYRVVQFAKECIYVCSHELITKVKYFVPILLTLLDKPRGIIENVFIVPIRYFRDFLNRIEYYIDLTNKELLIKNEYYLQEV